MDSGVGVKQKGQGDSPLEFGVGDANVNCPPDFVMFQTFKDQYIFNVHQ